LPHFLTSKLFARYGIQGIFSERLGGISPAPFNSLNLGFDLGDCDKNIQYNLTKLCNTANIPIPHRSQQTHGTDYLLCDGKGIQHEDCADILITCNPGHAVAIRTADCLPILLIDPITGIAAAVHAGWRGTAKKVAHIAVQRMHKFGAKPENILACLGPSIASCCFKIDSDTANTLSQSHPNAEQYIHHENNKFSADIQNINQLQLQYSGLQQQNIEHISLCTSCMPERFFSYRRDGVETGRQLAIVALPA